LGLIERRREVMSKHKKPGLIYPPEGGWKEQCYYLVDVSYSSGNPVHRAIFFTGFLHSDGNPGGYSNLWGSYDAPVFYSPFAVYYMKALRQLTELGEMCPGHIVLPDKLKT
jgi:hypothetical protein